MKFSSFLFASGFFVTVSAFQSSVPHSSVTSSKRTTNNDHNNMFPVKHQSSSSQLSASIMGQQTLDISPTAQRDVYQMQEWARQCGVQTAEGVEVSTADGQDWSLVANQDLAAGSPVLYVPAQMILSASGADEEFGGNLEAAENALANMDREAAQRLPLFKLMVKILVEYEKGPESPFYPWLNSLPRQFYNGVSMTGTLYL